MRRITVSIICNTYNHEKYIRDALEGFVNQQTNFSYEVLIHDDASTDGTPEIIKEYEKKYPDVIFPIYQSVNQYSLKKNITLQYQIPRARGKYIALCEGDDYWTDNFKLQKQFQYMEDNPTCALVAHEAVTMYMPHKYIRPFVNYDFHAGKEVCKLSTSQVIDNHLLFPTASMFFRKEFYVKHYELLSEIKNFDYVLKILLATEGYVYVIPEIMSVYRKGVEGSWTQSVQNNAEKFEQHMSTAVQALSIINEYTKHEYSKELEKNILKRKFDVQKKQLNISELRKGKYRELYKNMTYKAKISLYMQKYAPHIFAFFYNVRQHMRR